MKASGARALDTGHNRKLVHVPDGVEDVEVLGTVELQQQRRLRAALVVHLGRDSGHRSRGCDGSGRVSGNRGRGRSERGRALRAGAVHQQIIKPHDGAAGVGAQRDPVQERAVVGDVGVPRQHQRRRRIDVEGSLARIVVPIHLPVVPPVCLGDDPWDRDDMGAHDRHELPVPQLQAHELVGGAGALPRHQLRHRSRCRDGVRHAHAHGQEPRSHVEVHVSPRREGVRAGPDHHVPVGQPDVRAVPIAGEGPVPQLKILADLPRVAPVLVLAEPPVMGLAAGAGPRRAAHGASPVAAAAGPLVGRMAVTCVHRNLNLKVARALGGPAGRGPRRCDGVRAKLLVRRDPRDDDAVGGPGYRSALQHVALRPVRQRVAHRQRGGWVGVVVRDDVHRKSGARPDSVGPCAIVVRTPDRLRVGRADIVQPLHCPNVGVAEGVARAHLPGRVHSGAAAVVEGVGPVVHDAAVVVRTEGECRGIEVVIAAGGGLDVGLVVDDPLVAVPARVRVQQP